MTSEFSFKLTDILFMFRGAAITLGLVCIATTTGGILGFLVGLIRSNARNRILRFILAVYVEFFRSTPLLLQIFLVFFALPLIGIEVKAIWAASLSLMLYTGSYISEITRAGILAIDRVQWNSGAALAMNLWQQLFYVILPQALRIMIPPAIGFLVGLVKDSSLVSIIGFMELTRISRLISDRTMEPLPVFGIASVIYFVICYPLAVFGRRIEVRLSMGVKKP